VLLATLTGGPALLHVKLPRKHFIDRGRRIWVKMNGGGRRPSVGGLASNQLTWQSISHRLLDRCSALKDNPQVRFRDVTASVRRSSVDAGAWPSFTWPTCMMHLIDFCLCRSQDTNSVSVNHWFTLTEFVSCDRTISKAVTASHSKNHPRRSYCNGNIEPIRKLWK